MEEARGGAEADKKRSKAAAGVAAPIERDLQCVLENGAPEVRIISDIE